MSMFARSKGEEKRRTSALRQRALCISNVRIEEEERIKIYA
jgi:hypothetical protein